MVSSRLVGILAIVIVMVAIAAGAIAWYDIDGDVAEDYCYGANIDKVWYQGGCNVRKVKLGGATGGDFALTMTPVGGGDPIKVYSNIDGADNINGVYRITTRTKPAVTSASNTISTYTEMIELSVNGVKIYNIVDYGETGLKCTYTIDDGTTAGLEAQQYYGHNTNTATMLRGCGWEVGQAADDCLWVVWDGDSDVGSWSSQFVVADRFTGVSSKWQMSVCTAGNDVACDAGALDWNYCALGCDTGSGHPDCPAALSSNCASCDGFPPSGDEVWCSQTNQWFDVTHESLDPSALTPPTHDGADICVPEGDALPTSTPIKDNAWIAGIAPAVPPSPQSLRSAVTEQSKEFTTQSDFWYIWPVAGSTLGDAVHSYSHTGGQYGRYCGKGGNKNVQECPETSGSVCNDGGFDACCKQHDSGKHSRDLWGVATISTCEVDDIFKKCRTPDAVCSLAGTSMGNHDANSDPAGSCLQCRNSANTLFDVLPCDNYEEVCGWKKCGWFWCWECWDDWVQKWPGGNYNGLNGCKDGCF